MSEDKPADKVCLRFKGNSFNKAKVGIVEELALEVEQNGRILR